MAKFWDKNQNTNITKDILVILVIVLLATIFFNRLIFFPGFNPKDDTRLYAIPDIKFLINNFKDGIFPLWDPHRNSGLPFIMHGTITPYYPSFFIFLLFPICRAISYQFLLHIWIAGIFTYLLARKLKLERLSSFICAISFIFSSLFIMCVGEGYLASAVSIAYLPILCFLFEMARESRRHLFSILGGIAFGASLVTGHYTILAIVLASFCLYCLIRFLQKPQKFSFISFLIFIFIGFSIAAVQWIPLAEAMQFTWDKMAGELERETYQLFNLISYNPNPPCRNHMGIVPLILALFALLFHRKRSIMPFVVLAGASVLVFLGVFNKIVYLIPHNSVIEDSMYFFGVSLIFSISMLSGFGTNLFIKNKKNSILASNLLKAFIVSVTILDSGYYIFSLPYSRKPKFDFESYFRKGEVIDFLAKDKSVFRILSIEKRAEEEKVLKPNQGLIYNYQSVAGNVKIPIRRYNEFISLIDGRADMIIWGKAHQGFSLGGFRNYNSRLIDLLNVKYILSDGEIKSDKFRLVFSDDEIKAYENKDFQPRAFIVSEFKVIKTKDEIFEELKDSSFDFKKTVILEEEPEIPFVAAKGNTESNVNIIKHSPNELVMKTFSSKAGFLVLSQIYMPGWKAYLDGKETKVYQADYILNSMYLPCGIHKVKFVYSPFSFKLGLAITLAALAVVFSCLIIYFLKRFLRKSDDIKK